MRRNRRGRGAGGMEFGGSGEDSFVAVVVTKLTGALLFILLLTMVIMALLPKAIDLPSSPSKPGDPADGDVEPTPLVVTTGDTLPEAIVGRPYRVALAADGGRGHLTWTLAGLVPEGLAFNPATGTLEGTPTRATADPAPLTMSVSDGKARASRVGRLTVYLPDGPLATPSRWKPALPPIPWREWLDQGFGFVVLWLVFWMAIVSLDAVKRRRIDDAVDGESARALGRRFLVYKLVLTTLAVAASAALIVVLRKPPG